MSYPVKLGLKLPYIPNIERVAHDALQQIGDFKNINEDKVDQASILVSEAINNALEHADCSNTDLLEVDIELSKKKLIIYIKDYGSGFNTENVEKPDINKKIKSKHKRGWGLQLMRSLSDNFEIESGESGTKIIMYLNL